MFFRRGILRGKVPRVEVKFQRADIFESLAGDESREILKEFRVMEAESVRAVEDGDRFVIAVRPVR